MHIIKQIAIDRFVAFAIRTVVVNALAMMRRFFLKTK